MLLLQENSSNVVLASTCFRVLHIHPAATLEISHNCNEKNTLFAGLLARSQYSEGPATGHLGTGFSWFPCVYKRKLRWFPRLQVTTACFLCSPPDFNLLDPYFIFMYMHYNHCHRATAHLQLNILLLLLLLLLLYKN